MTGHSTMGLRRGTRGGSSSQTPSGTKVVAPSTPARPKAVASACSSVASPPFARGCSFAAAPSVARGIAPPPLRPASPRAQAQRLSRTYYYTPHLSLTSPAPLSAPVRCPPTGRDLDDLDTTGGAGLRKVPDTTIPLRVSLEQVTAGPSQSFGSPLIASHIPSRRVASRRVASRRVSS